MTSKSTIFINQLKKLKIFNDLFHFFNFTFDNPNKSHCFNNTIFKHKKRISNKPNEIIIMIHSNI